MENCCTWLTRMFFFSDVPGAWTDLIGRLVTVDMGTGLSTQYSENALIFGQRQIWRCGEIAKEYQLCIMYSLTWYHVQFDYYVTCSTAAPWKFFNLSSWSPGSALNMSIRSSLWYNYIYIAVGRLANMQFSNTTIMMHWHLPLLPSRFSVCPDNYNYGFGDWLLLVLS